MEFTEIKQTSIRPSRIGLGTWAIGGWMWGGADDESAVATIHRALDAGITLIDTAPAYGQGHSEEVVGRALEGRRDGAVIATKVALEWDEHGTPHRNASARRIRAEVEDSLRRLRTDRIDIYQVHWPDPDTPMEETAHAMAALYDAGLIRAHKRPPVRVADGSNETVDYGFVGNIDSVNADVIEKLLENGLMPVVSPLSADANGVLLNINADTVAAAIGGALSAEKLVLCTGAQGILERVEDPRSVISYTDIKGLKRLREEGALKDGMLPKAAAIESAIRGGVRRVHVISYKSPDSLLAEIFTNEGTGTLVVADLTALSPAEQLSAAAGA